jgi:nitroreductase
MLDKIRPAYNRPWFKEAPHILLVIGNKSQAWEREYDCYNALETDVTIVMDHLILAAAHEGVASCWIANFNPTILRDALVLNENEYVYTLSPLGYPKGDYVKKSTKQRKSFIELVHII